MKHLSTNYWQFINEAATTTKPNPINTDKIEAIKQQQKSLENRLRTETDSNRRKRLQMQIKVCDLRIMIAQIQ